MLFPKPDDDREQGYGNRDGRHHDIEGVRLGNANELRNIVEHGGLKKDQRNIAEQVPQGKQAEIPVFENVFDILKHAVLRHLRPGDIVFFPESRGGEHHAQATDQGKDPEHRSPGPDGSKSRVLQQIHEESRRVHEGAGAHEQPGADSIEAYPVPRVRDHLRHKGVPGNEIEGIGHIIQNKEKSNPNGIEDGACPEGRHEDQKHGQGVGKSRFLHKGHPPPLRIGALVRQVRDQRVRHRIHDFTEGGNHRHDGYVPQELVLRQQIGNPAFHRGLEKINQIIANQAIKKALGNVRHTKAVNLSFG